MRLSYGASGEAPDASYYNTYTPYGYTYNGRSAVVPSNIELSSLKWQTLIGKNLGFNLGILKSRITASFDFYQNTTKDLFYKGLNIATTSGFQTVSMNIGTVDNNGWEVSLNTTPIKSRKLIVGFDFNIARNANSITSVSDDYPRESSTGLPGLGKYKSYLILGNPFGSYYGFKFTGVYKDKNSTIATDDAGKPIVGPNGQVVYMRYNYPLVDYTFQPGDAMYQDVNHDGNIDYRDMVYLGNGIPKFVGGFGPTITINGNFTVKAFFNFRWGYDIVNGAKISTTDMYGVDNQSKAVLRRWRNPGDVTDIPRAVFGVGYNWLGSDRYVEDASFVRLASVTARYNLPKLLLQKLGLTMCSVYVTGQNLATWTNYTGQNPDVSTTGSVNPFSYPVDNALTPPSIQYTVGVSVGF